MSLLDLELSIWQFEELYGYADGIWSSQDFCAVGLSLAFAGYTEKIYSDCSLKMGWSLILAVQEFTHKMCGFICKY